jgi:hypothetical protein
VPASRELQKDRLDAALPLAFALQKLPSSLALRVMALIQDARGPRAKATPAPTTCGIAIANCRNPCLTGTAFRFAIVDFRLRVLAPPARLSH